MDGDLGPKAGTFGDFCRIRFFQVCRAVTCGLWNPSCWKISSKRCFLNRKYLKHVLPFLLCFLAYFIDSCPGTPKRNSCKNTSKRERSKSPSERKFWRVGCLVHLNVTAEQDFTYVVCKWERLSLSPDDPLWWKTKFEQIIGQSCSKIAQDTTHFYPSNELLQSEKPLAGIKVWHGAFACICCSVPPTILEKR